MAFVWRFFHGQKCPGSDRVDGKTIIVTGANTGIGKEAARELVHRGGRVILACRDDTKGGAAVDDIQMSTNNVPNAGSAIFKQLDLASLDSIRKFAREIIETEPKVDILINNAGVMVCPHMTTDDGFEMQFGVNHLGHFLLTNLLLDRLKQSSPARIVVVSSQAHKFGKINFDDLQSEKEYTPMVAYSQSKLANLLFVHELAKRLKGTGVTVYGLHPGVIKSDLWRYSGTTLSRIVPWLVWAIGGLIMKSVVEGSQTTVYVAVAEHLKEDTGFYYSDCEPSTPVPAALDDEVASKLWDVSAKLTKLQ